MKILQPLKNIPDHSHSKQLTKPAEFLDLAIDRPSLHLLHNCVEDLAFVVAAQVFDDFGVGHLEDLEG
jgi:hypothetical protein